MRHSLKLLLTTTVLTVSSSFAADQPLLPNSSNDATDSSVVTAEKQGVSPMKHSKVLELFRSVPSPFFGFFPESEDLWCTGYLDVSSIAALETAFASAGKKIAKNKTETYIERLNRIRIFYTKISFLTNHDERIRFLGVRPSGNNSDEDLALLNEALGNKNITFWNDFGFLILEGVKSLLCYKLFTPEHSKNHHPLALDAAAFATSLKGTLQAIINLGYPSAAADTYELIALSNATPDTIFDAAWEIVGLDGTDAEKIEFRRRAANLYEIAANHRDATPKDIVESMYHFSRYGNARKTIELGNIFANHPDTTIDYFYNTVNRHFARSTRLSDMDIALSLYKIVTNHKDATPSYISAAAEGVATLGDTKAAVELYIQSANHPKATHWNISNAANAVAKLGDTKAAVELYIQIASHNDAAPWNISDAANAVATLGDTKAAVELYIQIASHNDAAPWNISDAANAVATLGDTNAAVELFVKSANHPKATPWNISDAANAVATLGDTNAAVELFVKSANHPKATLSDIFRAADAVATLGDTKAAVELYIQIANYKDATLSDIFRAADAVATHFTKDPDLTLLMQILAGPNIPQDFINRTLDLLSEKLRHNYDDKINKINAFRNRFAPLNR